MEYVGVFKTLMSENTLTLWSQIMLIMIMCIYKAHNIFETHFLWVNYKGGINNFLLVLF